jgi:hypothetical protein
MKLAFSQAAFAGVKFSQCTNHCGTEISYEPAFRAILRYYRILRGSTLIFPLVVSNDSDGFGTALGPMSFFHKLTWKTSCNSVLAGSCD